MPQAVDNVAFALEQLSERVRHLENRVAALEGRSQAPSTAEPNGAFIALQRPPAPATWRGFPPLETPSGAVSILGKAVLGIAGAYLLRALAESSAIPKLPVLLVAVVYACFWMVWAVRVHVASRFASSAYAVTSALILSPLLWESTVRFQVLSPAVAAAITVAFVVFAIALAWREDLQLIPWVATLASVITAVALIIETHELVALTVAMLAVALITEAAACLGHRLTLRAIPALGADFAAWLLVFILASETIPEGYHAATSTTIAGLCFLLLAIYGASIGIRSFVLRHPITAFEVGQAFIAFLLATYGIVHATRGALARPLGATFLLLSAACYWGTLSRFANERYARNRRVSATWAAGLLLTGSFLLFPASFQIPFLALAAAVATYLYTRTHKLSLGMHASFYLSAAVAVSTVPVYAADALAQDVAGTPDWRVWVILAAAAVCYALGSRSTEEQRRRRMLWLIPGAVVAFTVTALAVVAIVHLASIYGTLNASILSMIRTTVICAVALALGFLGARGARIELGWLAYATVGLGTLKLFLEDLRFGNAASLVVSLFFYGLILVLLPRLTRRGEAD
jgi:hypothetical protein